MRAPLNIAHRGLTREFPDNTLEAFEAAIAVPADGIECDVRETADGHFVMAHDAEIEGQPVNRLSLAQVRAFRPGGGCRIPTLEETIETCRRRVLLNIEIKQAPSLEAFLSLVRSLLTPDEVVLTSFSRDLVVDLARRAPGIRRGVITAGPIDDAVELAATTMSDIVVVRFPHADRALVEASHGAHRPVFVWGLADPAEVRTALGLEVDGVITDFADETEREIARLRG